MSQWHELQELASKNQFVQSKVKHVFKSSKFPVDIRIQHGEWIEANFSENLHHLEEGDLFDRGKDLFQELLKRIENKEKESSDLGTELILEEQKNQLTDNFKGDYAQFVRAVQHFLHQERTIIDGLRFPNGGDELFKKGVPEDTCAEENKAIHQTMDTFERKLLELNMKIRTLEEEQDMLMITYGESQVRIVELEGQVNGTMGSNSEVARQLEALRNESTITITQNFKKRQSVQEAYVKTAVDLTDILKSIWADLDAWEKERRLNITALTKYKENAISLLNKLCTRGNKLLLDVLQKGNKILDIFNKLNYNEDRCKDIIQTVRKELEGDYMKEHLKRIFIVEKNPQRILKVSNSKSHGFTMSVCILGGEALGLATSNSKVTAKLFTETDLNSALQNPDKEGFCGVVNGHNKAFDCITTDNSSVGRWVANFSSAQLQGVRRLDREKDELVTDFKFGMVFYTQIRILENTFPLQTVSQPMVLTSQTSQECMANGTLIWDAAFSSDVREFYKEAKDARWVEFASVLNALFVERTGRGLSQEQIDYLAQIAFKGKNGPNYTNQRISRSQIIRDKLSRTRDFSFWKWFYCCLNLISIHLKKEWKDGVIYGFLGKNESKEKLMRKVCGTFLLRFSETDIENSQRAEICGYLSVAVKETHPRTGEESVFYIKDHLTPKDLQERSLAQILEAFEVRDYQNAAVKKQLLQYLWPDFQFHLKFQPFLTEKKTKDGDYEKGRLKIEYYLGGDAGHSEMPLSPSSSVTSQGPSLSSMPSPDTLADIEIECAQSPKIAKVMPLRPRGPSIESEGNAMDTAYPDIHLQQPLDIHDDFSNLDIRELESLNGNHTAEQLGMLVQDQDGDMMLGPEFQLQRH